MEPNDLKKEYEISFLVKNEEDASDIMKRLAQHEAEVLFEGPMRRIALAYPIKKEENAVFGYLHFSLLPASLPTLDHDLKVSASVLRFLIITPPFTKERPAPLERKPAAGSEPASTRPIAERRPSMPLSNEALEKKIEEILQ